MTGPSADQGIKPLFILRYIDRSSNAYPENYP